MYSSVDINGRLRILSAISGTQAELHERQVHVDKGLSDGGGFIYSVFIIVRDVVVHADKEFEHLLGMKKSRAIKEADRIVQKGIR